jgi:hypothetical protein
MARDVMTGKSIYQNNDLKTVGGRETRKVPFRTFSF